MVLFKRKPVQFLTPPIVKDDNTEVWHIKDTGEYFVHYEDYLNRLDFYKQKRFICQISGRSSLTFFDALKSEINGGAEVELAFPESLKGPVLRKVQFSIVPRIDGLVDKIFDELRTDYYPGETITVLNDKGDRQQGTIRGKTHFGAKIQPDGELVPAFSRYTVQLADQPTEPDQNVSESKIIRDRKTFTKSMLRSFIRKTATRDPWNGAPWVVRESAATTHAIDTKVPEELMNYYRLQEKRMLKHGAQDVAMSGMFPSADADRLPDLKPGNAYGTFAQNGQQFPLSLRNGFPPMDPLPPPPPPPKYPIEDLQVPPRDRPSRPLLKYWCKDPPANIENMSLLSKDILMKSVGPLLETWDTLNVYCEIFKLDSFTFDDFAEALTIANEDLPVQLFEEIHCSVLKIIVNEQGNTDVALPEVDEEMEDEEEEREPTPEPEPRRTKRATRSSLAKMEAERIAAEAAAAEKEKEMAELTTGHRAADLVRDFDWVDQLAKRQFKDGGWETIMVGLLYRLSYNPRLQGSCEDLLNQLAPPSIAPTKTSVKQRYSVLDVNYRIQALQILCMLTAETKAIRGYMEECSQTMTGYRKEKIEWQRQRKEVIEELKGLNDQRRALLPQPDPLPPHPFAKDQLNGIKNEAKEDGKTTDAESPMDQTNTDDTDDEPHQGRNLRRGGDRAAERRRKREEEQERKDKEKETASKAPRQSKQLIKVLKEIQKKDDVIKKCEEEIAILDNDLRENDCPRTRVLGKDRFWNRYYWFERNGMPYGGLPTSSTANANYANGMLWVQGPDDMEREGYIDMETQYQDEYKLKFGITVPERKKKEEGATSVYNARQWGYYSEPHELEALIKWLDVRGYNEMRLRKELINYKERISNSMKNRKMYVDPPKEEELEKEAEKAPAKKANFRTKSQQAEEMPSYRSLAWDNIMAWEELGHLHSEPPPPPRKKQRRR